jgi:hypothetical protein
MEMCMRLMSMALLLSGCGLSVNTRPNDTTDTGTDEADADTDTDTDTDSDTDTDTDTDVDMTAISIESVSPPYGPLSGGQSVLISGGPFGDSAVVTFGEAEAETTLVTANEIVATVPVQDVAGAVTVSVVVGSDGGQREGGYTYFDNAEGLAGTLGWSTWAELTGGYWNGGSYSVGAIRFLFLEPLDLHAWQLTTPTMDSCVGDGEYSYTGDIFVLDLGVEEVTLIPQVGEPFTVPYNPSGATNNYFFELDPISQSSFVSGGWYDLDLMTSGTLAGLAADDFFRNTSPLEVLEPAISGSTAPTVTPDQLFRWTPASNAWVELSMGVVSADGTVFEDFVTCIAADDGEFQMDSTKFAAWASGRQINVYVTAVREAGGVLEHNFSDSRIVGQSQLIGAGFSR